MSDDTTVSFGSIFPTLIRAWIKCAPGVYKFTVQNNVPTFISNMNLSVLCCR